MIIRLNYFRKHNDNKEIDDYKEFYKKFSNEREFGGSYEHYNHLFEDRFSDIFATMYKTVLRKKPNNILDIGSGVGKNLPFSKLFENIDYYAIDYAEKTVQKGQEIFPNINFSVGDAFNLEFKPDKFDMAIISHLLILYKEESDRVRILKEAQRIINEKGIVVVTVWKDSFFIKLSILLSRFIGKLLKIPLPQDFMGIHFTEKEMKKTIYKARLEVDTIIHTSELEGLNIALKYLTMQRYKRDFKNEEKNPEHISQNYIQDLKDSLPSNTYNKIVFNSLYFFYRLFPKLFNFHSIYILKKQ